MAAAVMNMKTLILLAILMMATVAVAATTTPSDEADLARFPGRRRRRNRHGGRTPSPSPNRPSPAPATPVPAPSSPSPSPPGILLPCNRPDVPPMLSVSSGQNGTGGGGTRTDCIPTPSPSPPSPRTPPQPRFRRPQRPPLCTCPKTPGFGVPAPGGGAGGGFSLGQDCVAPLAPLMACGTFITGGAEDTPSPQSDCCLALGAFVNRSSAATAAGAGDGGLRCLCPVIVGDVNRVLPRPVDPVRLMYLPISCGVVLPPETLFMCFTGHPSPHKVSKFSQVWELHG